ncbi:Translocation protein [Wickerhamomyces ciferrii]|uniref:Translocation protein SEC62 n=1 Tax=Wickerhamomyces ciferrii (strain ATCC 14091 / BCRC 22168 / CBS 111 / JCM 3599 / NBRC 0793 / NRRL Y-1031 F-60-10) TaxID=1206466 RepID=K0KZC2_WICCF|nr:Translocation protein [Wickerhamomyces ciferrii]CCH46699.1 Translocation protein [Wickerhamomyces ciferrii]
MSAQVNPVAVSVASFLRKNETLKQRQGLIAGNVKDFFRFKRAERALLSESYKEKQANPKNQLPPINDSTDVHAVFTLLIKNQLVLPFKKLTTSEAREQGFIPKKDKPVLIQSPRADLIPDEYYVWFYVQKSIWDSLMGFGLLAGIFTLILFPLWPLFMRKGVWYLSMGLLGLIGLFFVIAIIRMILFGITYFVLSPGLWIFPNLFEDVGFFDSFKPLYEWNYSKEKKSKKSKKAKKTVAQSPLESVENQASTTTTTTNNNNATGTGANANEGAANVRRRATLEEVEE